MGNAPLSERLRSPESGPVLIDENLKSVQARYPHCVDNPESTPGPNDRFWQKPYRYMPVHPDRLTIAEAFKAIACYSNQACEHDEWEKSP